MIEFVANPEFELTPVRYTRICAAAPRPRRPTAEEGGEEAASTWRPDRAANMIVGEIVIREEHEPLLTNGLNIDGVEPGFAYPCTVHLVRAQENLFPMPVGPPEDTPRLRRSGIPPQLEVATLHLGRYATLSDGFEITLMASEPWRGNLTYASVAAGRTFVKRDDQAWHPDVEELTEDGFEYDVCVHETPVVRPIRFYSSQATCGVQN